jgi:6-phosphogluconolactonase
MTYSRMAALALFSFVSSTALASDLRQGAVYLMTNQSNNAVIAYERSANGALARVGRFFTGGSGDTVPQGTDPPIDPLASQGSLVLSDDGRFLFAVNAGSNEITSFAVGKSGLNRMDTDPSGGERPISITVHEGLVYVLNEGGTPNITAFRVGSSGNLSRLAGSTRSLPSGLMADPAQVDFSPSGTRLVVTEKLSNLIATFPIRADGQTASPTITSSNGLTPFGFGFDGRGHLIVSEAGGGLPEASSLSSYQLMPGAVLETISAAVPDFLTAACWIVVTGDRRFVYTSNAGSGEVSSYRLRNDGSISLLDSTASNTSDTSGPIDMALSNDSRYLFVHQAGRRAIAVFRIESDGRLTRLAGPTGLPFGAQGIAAR